MWRLWDETGEVHGDVHLENILCDIEGRAISFVDPGPPRMSWYCDEATKFWYPVSRDLAYFLFDVASGSPKVALRTPRGARRHIEFGERIVRSVLAGIGSDEDKRMLLEEVRACIKLHLTHIRAGWTPFGVWRRLVKMVTSRIVSRMLIRLTANSDYGGGFSTSSAAAAVIGSFGKDTHRDGHIDAGPERHRLVDFDRTASEHQ
jgi:hypothetical protein